MIPPLHFDHEKLDPDQYRVGESASGLTTLLEDEQEHEQRTRRFEAKCLSS
jgi:hypothetical protein